MANKSKRKAPVMDQDERERLQQRIESEKKYKNSLGRDLPEKGHMGVYSGAGPVDGSKIDNKISSYERAIQDGAADPVNPKDRDALAKKQKELAEWLADKALTVREQSSFPKHGHIYHTAVKKCIRNEVGNPEFSKKAAEYRDISRQLEPDNPDAGSIEALRREQ